MPNLQDRKLGRDQGKKIWIDRNKLPAVSYILGRLWNGWAKGCIDQEDVEALEVSLKVLREIEEIIKATTDDGQESFAKIINLVEGHE